MFIIKNEPSIMIIAADNMAVVVKSVFSHVVVNSKKKCSTW